MKTRLVALAVLVAGVLFFAAIPAGAQGKKTIYIGILPLQQPEELFGRFGGFIDYLSQATGYNFELRLYRDTPASDAYTESVVRLVDGDTPFAYLAPVTIVQARANDPRVEPVVSAQRDGAPTYVGHIAVRTDSPIQTVEDLRGKKVIGASASSTSGNLMPKGHLIAKGIKDSELAALDFAGGHDKAALAVLAGDYDACWINDQSFQKMKDQGAGLRSIWVHPPVPEFPICVNTGYASPELLAKVKAALLKMHETHLPAIQAIDPKYEKWVAMTWEDFQPTKEIIDQVHGAAFYDKVKQYKR